MNLFTRMAFKTYYVDEPPVVPPANDLEDLPESAKGKTTFTQEEFNKALGEDRRKHKARIEKHVKELEDVRKSKNLTDKEKQSLQTKIDELNNSLLTKEELARKEKEKLETNYKTQLDATNAEKSAWQNRFIQSTISQSIVSQAAQAEAFNPDDLIAILGPNTKLVQDKDDQDKELESFTPKVKFKDTDKDGKAVDLDLTVEQAVKRMKEIDRYGHLFKSTAKKGLGGSSGTGKTGIADVSKMTPEQYREWRKKEGLARKVIA